MLAGLAASLLFIFLMADNTSSIWSRTRFSSQTDGVSSFLLSDGWDYDRLVTYWASWPCTVIHENVSFGFDVGDSATFVWHSFIWWIGIWSTVHTLNDMPHVWSIWVLYCIFEKIFPTLCLDLVYSFVYSMRWSNFLVLEDCPTMAMVSADFSSHV